MPEARPEQIDRLLASVEYPASKDDLLERARSRRTAQAVRSLLEQLPAQQFDAPATVRQALEKLQPSLKQEASPVSAAAGEQGGGEPGPSPRLQLPEPVRQAAEDVRIRSGRLIGQARTEATVRADEQRGVLAQSLAATAQQIRESGTRLNQQGQAQSGQLMEIGAQQLQTLSTYLERTDVRQIAQQAQEFARRQPLLVLGIGIGLGAIATRLLKSANLGRLTGEASSPTPGGDGQAAGSTDALTLLEADHRQIRQLLRRGESAGTDSRQAILAEIKAMLQAHERMEEEVFYPALLENPSTRQIVLESYAEHHVVDEIMSEIEQTDVSDELWKARFTTMKENLEHHVEEEESELFKLTRMALTRGELADLGSRMKQIKQVSAERAPA